VETLATRTELDVRPVWSLKALAGIFELPDPPPELPEEELVELQATDVVATSATMISAVTRVLDSADPKAPP
jgi:hypothetical protein